MDISHEATLSPNVPAEQEFRPILDSEWVEYRFLPTPGFDNDWRSGLNSIPQVRDWRFSPSGRTGVKIINGKGIGYVVLILDVYNKLWFAHSIKRIDLEFKDILTYHMLDENTLIIVERLDCYFWLSVKQHIIKVDLQTRKATFKDDVVHRFFGRHKDPGFKCRRFYGPNVTITVDGKCYTALISDRSRGGKLRVIVYLVPLDPSCGDTPKEFSFLMELSGEDKRKLRLLKGYHYSFDFTGFSSDGLLYFMSLLDVEQETKLLGVYFTVDVSKLTDIYNTQIVDQISLDRNQVDFMKLVSDPVLRLPGRGYTITENGSFGLFQPNRQLQDKEYTYCQVHKIMKTLKISITRDSWLNLHPCGAVLQFKMSPVDKRLFVRVASHWKNTLFSKTSSKLIFNKNSPNYSVEKLHRLVFDKQLPISLDETAKKALGTYEEYVNLIELTKKKQESDISNAMWSLASLAFEIPFIILTVIHFCLFLM